jgi:hypothetical protein
MIGCLVVLGGQLGHQLRDVAKHVRDRPPQRLDNLFPATTAFHDRKVNASTLSRASTRSSLSAPRLP